MEDGQVTVTDTYHLIDPFRKMADAWSGINLVAAEFGDLDAKEIEDLCTTFKTEFKIPQESVEAAVESAMDLAKSAFSWYKNYVAKK